MSKQLLTLGIVLSLGTAGCAGFGLQQGSSLSAQLQQERGLDSLWSSSEEAPTGGLGPAAPPVLKLLEITGPSVDRDDEGLLGISIEDAMEVVTLAEAVSKWAARQELEMAKALLMLEEEVRTRAEDPRD